MAAVRQPTNLTMLITSNAGYRVKAMRGMLSIVKGQDPEWFEDDGYNYELELEDFISCVANRVPFEEGAAFIARMYMFWYYGLGACPTHKAYDDLTLDLVWSKWGERLYSLGLGIETVSMMRDNGIPCATLTGEHRAFVDVRVRDVPTLRNPGAAAHRPGAGPPDAATVDLERRINDGFVFDVDAGMNGRVMSRGPGLMPGMPDGVRRPDVPLVRRYSIREFFATNREYFVKNHPSMGFIGVPQVFAWYKAQPPGTPHVHTTCAWIIALYRAALERVTKPALEQPGHGAPAPVSEKIAELERICHSLGSDVSKDLATLVAMIYMSPDGSVDAQTIKPRCRGWKTFLQVYISESHRSPHEFFLVDRSSPKNHVYSFAPDVVISAAFGAYLRNL